MIEIRNLTRRFGALTAVDDISFTVNSGEVLGFLGPNGAGKSTTMRMVTGFLRPTSGSVMVCGHDMASDPIAAQRRIGYLPEGAPLYPDMTTAALLDFVAAVRGFDGDERRRRVDDVVHRVHLEEVLHRRIEHLSKGFKRRVGLAQALVHDPEVLVLDEPTDGLDPNQKHEVRQLIRQMAAEKVIVLSTHILEEVDAVCTRAIIIADGRLLVDATPDELEARSRRHNAVFLRVRTSSAPGARESLAALDGVAEVEALEEANSMASYRLYVSPGVSVLGAVGIHVREQGWEVDELHAERGRLDEVFREITTQGAAT